MTKISYPLPTVALVLLGTVAAFTQATSTTAAAKKPATEKKVAAVHTDPGERAFRANCSRCHTPPEGLPPRITGTVVRHMRVRANLSAEDERLILGYLNP